ncbi:MAG: fumarylacetoacetase [Parvularculaceae bacterium]
MIDETHDRNATSWVAGADIHEDFPVQNLPLGIFSSGGSEPRAGAAIGDYVFDLPHAFALLEPMAEAACNALRGQTSLNAFMSLTAAERRNFRRAVFRVLTDPGFEEEASKSLVAADDCVMRLPIDIRDYTDFYAGIHHARNVGSLLRPENPLLPNYKFIPVGYHGRSSSIRVSGADVTRPRGQIRPNPDEPPVVEPCRRLDYEVELGIWVGGRSALGAPVPISKARDHIAGLSLLNDWSARDIQAWEYQPLGPFLAKNFATTISPWIITAEALEPFRAAPLRRPEGDPAPLEYLVDDADQEAGAYDIRVEVFLRTHEMAKSGDAATLLGSVRATDLYWTPAQMVAHHTVNGCDIAAGDLMGTGTISGAGESEKGSMMELSCGGRREIVLPNGETRTFLEDGDEVTMTGWAERAGFRRIGFGRCGATIKKS